MTKKLTLKARIVNLLAANGPMTKKEILTALCVKPTSYAGYFAPRINVDPWWKSTIATRWRLENGYAPRINVDPLWKKRHTKRLEDMRKASLVASGRIKAVGKNARGEVLYTAC